MTPQPLIYIVDDAADNRLLLRSLLEDKYRISEAESGEQCLSMLEQEEPDLILLDINMPGISGYHTCLTIRKTARSATIPVIFVSARDSAEERLAGFEAGADDYLTKPIDGTLLLEKIEFHLQRCLSRKQAIAQSHEAMNVAMEAMTSSSELGQIIHFVKEVQAIQKGSALAVAIMTVAAQFGLNCCVLIDEAEPVLLGCTAGSMEAKVLMKFRNVDQRITHLGVRTVIHSGMVIILIKNMPLDDEARYGRLKDHLAVLADIANGRAQSIAAESNLSQQRTQFLRDLIALAEDNIRLTSNDINAYTESVTNTVSDMVIRLEGMLFSLGLEEDQEKKLMKLANQTTARLDDMAGKAKDMDGNLSKILEALYDLLAQQ
ncbi:MULTISPECIES: response regulator [Oceanospirillaceae]|uniref:response regulator n=1 Tax=Oceanospirillaceae TaxID=135620 RepID=UPI001192F46C|nr:MULTISPECIES: response regulator [Thalassolituus]MCB2385910.1 response regulator [Thalassolituus alkanivorans]MCB2421760.1 response regulator [Thalassolituus alkanivorans]TVV43656.1 response regulator [Thalassolituus sp. C2-1]